MKKTIIRITGFILILTICLGYLNSVFKLKYGDGIYCLKKYYELEKDTVDVLVLGSSHAFEDFNTGTLWDEYGISSFVLGGSTQPMWNTYYYLKEALKYKTPDLIVLEGYGTTFTPEFLNAFVDDSKIIKNVIGFNWSSDKVDLIQTSVPENQWNDFYLEYPLYHNRYKEMSKAEFFDNQGNPFWMDWKGFGCNMETQAFAAPDISGISDKKPLYEKTEQYYRAILELAAEENIPIIVVVAPYACITEEDQKLYNTASEIAGEYDVPFVNCNLLYDEIGIDWMLDAADAGHLNYRGNRKFTSYIGGYIKDNYSLTDHRGDQRYSTWEANAEFIDQMIYDQELIECTELQTYIEKLKNESYWVFISVDGTCNTEEPYFSYLFDSFGIPKDGGNGICYIKNSVISWDTSLDDGELYIMTEPHDFLLKRNADGSDQIIIDGENYLKVTNGVNIVVYDTVTEEIVDSVGFDADAEYLVVR